MAIDANQLSQALRALGANDLQTVKDALNKACDDLQDEIDKVGGDDLENEFDLVNAWLQALENATQTPSPQNTQKLLDSIQAVDAASAGSTALNNLLAAVDGVIQAAPG